MSQKKLAIVKLSALGDVVQALHALSSVPLKRNFSEITWVCESAIAPLVKLSPYVDRVIALDLKRWKKPAYWTQSEKPWKPVREGFLALRESTYSQVLDLQGNMKSALITKVLRSKDRIGLPIEFVREKPASYFYHRSAQLPAQKITSAREMLSTVAMQVCEPGNSEPGNSEQVAEEKIALHRIKAEEIEALNASLIPDTPFLVVSAFSAWRSKEPSYEMLSVFIKRYLLRYQGAKVYILWSSAKEKERAESILRKLSTENALPSENIALLPSSLSLDLLAYLLSRSHCIVGCDSLVLHIAAWIGVPRFAFFGPTRARYYGTSNSKNQKSWQGTCPYGLRFDNRCPEMRRCASAPCMQHAPLFEVEQAIDGFFQQLNL